MSAALRMATPQLADRSYQEEPKVYLFMHFKSECRSAAITVYVVPNTRKNEALEKLIGWDQT